MCLFCFFFSFLKERNREVRQKIEARASWKPCDEKNKRLSHQASDVSLRFFLGQTWAVLQQPPLHPILGWSPGSGSAGGLNWRSPLRVLNSFHFKDVTWLLAHGVSSCWSFGAWTRLFHPIKCQGPGSHGLKTRSIHHLSSVTHEDHTIGNGDLEHRLKHTATPLPHPLWPLGDNKRTSYAGPFHARARPRRGA